MMPSEASLSSHHAPPRRRNRPREATDRKRRVLGPKGKLPQARWGRPAGPDEARFGSQFRSTGRSSAAALLRQAHGGENRKKSPKLAVPIRFLTPPPICPGAPLASPPCRKELFEPVGCLGLPLAFFLLALAACAPFADSGCLRICLLTLVCLCLEIQELLAGSFSLQVVGAVLPCPGEVGRRPGKGRRGTGSTRQAEMRAERFELPTF